MKRPLAAALVCVCCCRGWAAPASPALPTAPLVTNPALDDGGKRLAADDNAGAIRSLRDALHAQPGNAEAAHLLTVAYLHAGQLTQAMTAAQAELSRPGAGPDERARAALLLGTAGYGLFAEKLKGLKGRVDSFSGMKQMLESMAPRSRQLPNGDTVIDPGDDGLQSEGSVLSVGLRADIDDLRKTLAQADRGFATALSINPHLPGVHDGLGLVRSAQGYPGEARREFQSEIAAGGPNGSVYLHLAEIDAAQRDDDDAVKNFRLAAALSPDCETPYAELSAFYQSQGDAERAQWAQGMCALRRGDLRGAEGAFARSSRKTTDLLCARAQLAATRKHYADARALLDQAHAADAQNADVLTRLGDCEAGQGHTQPAIDFYHQALDIDVAFGPAWYGLGLAYDAQKDPQSAVADFREALKANPNDPDARLRLADDEAELGLGADSAADFNDYLRRFPTASNHYLVVSALTQNAAH